MAGAREDERTARGGAEDPRLRARDPRAKWAAPGAGERYRDERWGGRRRAGRDPRTAARLLGDLGVRAGAVLDAPCGAGRLRAELEAAGLAWVGLDASAAMLATASGAPARGSGASPAADGGPGAVRRAAVVRGDVLALPFRDGTFEAAVACRFLHHLREPDDVALALRELARVARRAVVASFWDAATLPALRRRLGLAPDEGPAGRVAHPRALLREAARAAGARRVAFHAAFPLLSQQTWVALAL